MRLHHLTVSAFGPFPGTETVDFDALNEAGLFLLCGATGAGKTSILDAVCFALYGTVPGVRGVKTLKSQHADEQTPPVVTLDFSVGARRFRVRRSPEWVRPKRRGTGTRTENAAASLTELTGGDEHFLTSRASEVGLMVSELVGMRATQFQQVAMLPQGEFQAFLHASSQQRHDVLQHLFRTDRFTRIEDWVADHSRTLKGRAARGEEAVLRLLHTIGDRSGVALPGSEEPAEAPPEQDGLAWARAVLDDARAALDSLTTRREQSGRVVDAARGRLDELRRQADVAARRDAAAATLAKLEAGAVEGRAAEAALADAARAAACRPVVAMLDEATSAVEACTRARTAAVRSLSDLREVDLDEAPDVERLDEVAGEIRARFNKVEALLPRSRGLGELAAAADASAVALRDALRSRQVQNERRDLVPARLGAARVTLAESGRTAARRDALVLQVREAAERARAAAALAPAERELDQLRDLVRDQRDAAADARDRVQALQAARLAGVAAELAGRLRDGDPCQVCGSLEHPAPAVSDAAPVTDEAQEAAEARYQGAQADYVAGTEELASAEAAVAALRLTADGLDAVEAARAHQVLVTELAAAEAAEQRREGAERAVAALEAELTEARDLLAGCEQEVARLEQRHEADVSAHRRALEELAEAVPGVAPAALPALAAELESSLGVLTRARAAMVQHEQAARRRDELAARAQATVAEHGFASVDAARDAVLDTETRARLTTIVDDRAARTAAARAVLASTEVESLGDAPAPDPTEAEAALLAAEDHARAAARSADVQTERVTALDDLVARLEAAVTSWRPLHEEHARAESMSRLVRGMGTDNQLQMRLSAYVLATRLDQVLDAANDRLSQMRDQRYLLRRTGRAARKGSQAGLGLEVLDQWTGDLRDPVTLSGGETFVVSLSLALGLADVVTQEAGGVEIETLFVDEGFGTLDPDTLDDVMDRLDGLRVGGRTVGVVSHVGELRTRIPAQVHVRKTPQGSTVHAATLVG